MEYSFTFEFFFFLLSRSKKFLIEKVNLEFFRVLAIYSHFSSISSIQYLVSSTWYSFNFLITWIFFFIRHLLVKVEKKIYIFLEIFNKKWTCKKKVANKNIFQDRIPGCCCCWFLFIRPQTQSENIMLI